MPQTPVVTMSGRYWLPQTDSAPVYSRIRGVIDVVEEATSLVPGG
jgi:hypothetical protein